MEAGGEELTVASSAFDDGRGSQLYKNKCDDIKSQLSQESKLKKKLHQKIEDLKKEVNTNAKMINM